MAETNSTNTGKKYLDEAGLVTFWGGVKDWVGSSVLDMSNEVKGYVDHSIGSADEELRQYVVDYVDGQFNKANERKWEHSLAAYVKEGSTSKSILELGKEYNLTIECTYNITGEGSDLANYNLVLGSMKLTSPNDKVSVTADSFEDAAFGDDKMIGTSAVVNFEDSSFKNTGTAQIQLSYSSRYKNDSTGVDVSQSPPAKTISARWKSYYGLTLPLSTTNTLENVVRTLIAAGGTLLSSYTSLTGNTGKFSGFSSTQAKCMWVLLPIGVYPNKVGNEYYVPRCYYGTSGSSQGNELTRYYKGMCIINDIKYVLFQLGPENGMLNSIGNDVWIKLTDGSPAGNHQAPFYPDSNPVVEITI